MNARSPMMGGSEVDFVTGLPVPEIIQAKLREQKSRLQERASHRHALRVDLASEGSNIVLSRIADELAGRIEQLIQADPECQALLRVIHSFQEELSLGRQAVEQLMKPIFEQL